ncbi:BamA/TamA family outer membrane protein [Gilvimarinus sp. F26214L]|uniref:BamA/TamA family outer membrane protein n=1 Tax=Gilvimarinus sp. DZF01 TaxID=3461371 RepID=UPI004045FA4E
MNLVVPESTHLAAPVSTRSYCKTTDAATRKTVALVLLCVLGCQMGDAHGQKDPDLEVGCRLFIEPGTADFDISEVPQPAEDVEFPEDAVVDEIVFTRYPIFNENDPEENNRLFQLVDFLHIDTRAEVIDDQLLFNSGDRFNKRIIDESARALRDSDYLYDARVWPYRICGNRVDVEVVTREVWTLSGGASVSRSGGSDETTVSISDSNFLGYGKTFSLSSTSSTDRDGLEFLYQDPNVAGSRYTLDVAYADNDDGSQTVVHGERPFYSLDARYAWGLHYSDHERVDDIYERGDDVASYKANERSSELYVGRSGGWENGVTRRWWFGVHASKDNYEFAADEVAPDRLPASREVNYPFLRFDFIEEDYIQVSNLNQMHRIEDFNLGRSWSWRLGVADTVFGSDMDRLVYSANYRNAWKINGSTLMQLETRINGLWRYNEDQSEDAVWESSWRWYNGAGRNHGTYLSLDLRLGRNLPVGQELLLGSEEQLRGYPARYQKGDRSFVFTAERRYYTDWHLWRLLRVGGAVFMDVGRAWEPGDDNWGATGILGDFGFGLRLASSRAQSRQIIHVDIAFPFEREDDIDGMQVLLTAKQSF